jgi:hypothetical protein
MATEYVFYGAADVSSAVLQGMIAAAVAGSVAADGTVSRSGMNVTAYHVEPDDESPVTAYFGFTHQVTITFRFDNVASAHERELNLALMVGAVLGFLDMHPGRGVLLFNGEEVTLQRLDDDVVFSSDWEDWTESDRIQALMMDRAVGVLAQPLM